VIAAEKAMLSRADLVVVVSPKLYEAKRPLNSETHLVPNGVDYEAYSAALADDHFPDRLAAIKPPRLGYSGLIGDRLDLATLKNLAQAHPDWSVVLLGEARVIEQAQTWQALQELPNVHYLGAVPISEVPYYLKGFQVGLMPYTQTRESEHISPLKLYDYLAAGIPVAAVDIPAVHDFGEHIHVAASAEHFEQAVGKALADTSLAQRKIRRSVAASHTWETRARQISVLLQTRLTTVLPVAG
jgi:glycosyltransferase involved in cell wall biosynthesis